MIERPNPTDPLVYLARLAAEATRRTVVIVHPDQHEEVKAAIDARPDLQDRIILRSAQYVDSGMAITFPEPDPPILL
jgi:hypothetical protein